MDARVKPAHDDSMRPETVRAADLKAYTACGERPKFYAGFAINA